MEEREEAYQESRKLREKDNQILNDLLPPEEELGVVSPKPKLSSTTKVKTSRQARGVTKPMTMPKQKSREHKKTVNNRSTPASKPVVMDNTQETLDISDCNQQEHYSNHLDVSHAEHESISDWFADADEDFMTVSDGPALQQTHHGKDGIDRR